MPAPPPCGQRYDRFRFDPRLQVEEFSQRPGFSGIEILLHQGERDTRTPRQLASELHRGVGELGVCDDAIGDAKRKRLRGIKRFSRVVEFTRLAGADELGQKITAAEVAGKSDIRERRDEARRLCGDTQIARQRQRHPGAGRRTIHHRDRGLGNFMKEPRHLHPAAQMDHGVFHAALD